MSGTVWRMEKNKQGTCFMCLAEVTGLLVEGVVEDGRFHELRLVCPKCFSTWREYLLVGENTLKTKAPAYAHR
ncbi:MAG: hypothetical protein ACUVRY_08920 [Thermoanaerobaculaceae bacterium]